MTPRAATFVFFVVNGAVVGTWLASIPGVQTSLGATGTEIGLILLVMAVGALVSQQLTGQALVRFSSRSVLLVTSFIFPVMTVVPLLAPTPVALAAVMFTFGAMNTAMDVSMNQHGIALEQARGSSILSGFHAGWSIGGILGAVGVGAALSVGVDRVAEAAVAGLLLWISVLVAGRYLGTGSSRTDGSAGISWPSRRVLPVAVLVLLIAVVEGGLSDWGGIYLRRGVGASAEVAAFAYAALSVGLTLGRLGGDRVKDAVGSTRLIQLGMLLSAAAIGLMLIIGNVVVAIAGLIIAGIGVANGIPQLFGAAGRIPPYGPSLSAAFTFLTLAFMAGPPVIGAATDALGVTTALGVLVLFSLAVTALVGRVPAAETNPAIRAGR